MSPRFPLRIAVAALGAACCAACSAGRPTTVSAAGEIGPLRVDTSTRADVVSFAGTPESERRGRYVTYAPFDALGYGCHGKPAVGRDGIPRCETVFYVDAQSGKLALLITSDRRYEFRGIHAGTTTAAAERRLHRLVRVGCLAALRYEAKSGFLVLDFGGGKIGKPPTLHLIGGSVSDIVVHSRRLNPGVLDCIDS